MEYLDIVDEENKITGKQAEREAIHTLGLWHREVGIWIYNEDGEVLLEKRSLSKKIDPGKWDLCAGHVPSGEEPEQAIIREANEEIGLQIDKEQLEFIGIEKVESNHPNGQIDRCFCYYYLLKTKKKEQDYEIQKEELSCVQYVPITVFKEDIEENPMNYGISNNEFLKKVLRILQEKMEK